MRGRDYGPVPISRLKQESVAIFQALAEGRRVLITKRGELVAAVDPPDPDDRDMLVAYATPGRETLSELTATEINQGSPSRAVKAAIEGRPSYVTRGEKVYGFLRSVSPAELAEEGLSLSEIEERDRLVAEYLAREPQTTTKELAAFTDEVTADLISRAGRFGGSTVKDAIRALAQDGDVHLEINRNAWDLFASSGSAAARQLPDESDMRAILRANPKLLVELDLAGAVTVTVLREKFERLAPGIGGVQLKNAVDSQFLVSLLELPVGVVLADQPIRTNSAIEKISDGILMAGTDPKPVKIRAQDGVIGIEVVSFGQVSPVSDADAGEIISGPVLLEEPS